MVHLCVMQHLALAQVSPVLFSPFAFLRFLSEGARRIGKRNKEKKTLTKAPLLVSGHTALQGDFWREGWRFCSEQKCGVWDHLDV